MEAKELMIKDWVLSDDEPTVVMQLDYVGNIFTAKNPYRPNVDVKPIPVTPEILLYNGWKLSEKWSGDDPCFELDFSKEDPNWMRNLYWANDSLYLGEYYYCDCFNLNTLQQALRLLGKRSYADSFMIKIA